jgi:hypothetical protein
MGFIDINPITIYEGGGSSGWGNWLKTLFSVIGGFLIKAGYDWWLKKKENKAVVEEFELQLSSIQDRLKKQIKIVREKRAAMATMEPQNIEVFFTDKMERIKSLTWLTLVKHYKNLKGKKEGSEYVGKIYNNLEILLIEVKRLEEGMYNFLEEGNIFMSAYKEALDIVRREHAIHADSLTPDQLKQDVIFQKFVELSSKYLKDAKITPKFILNLKGNFHLELFESPFDRNNSPMYTHVFNFNARARDLMMKYEWKKHDFETILLVVEESLTRIYEHIYNETLVI